MQEITIEKLETLEKAGARLAAACNWAGQDILAVAYHALVDANFHTEAAELAEVFEGMSV